MSDRQIHPAFEGDMAASYDARNEPLAPLRDALQLILGQLFLRDLPGEADILCVGAGTGLEIAALAELAPGWRFTALDPSADMLAICRQRMEAAGLSDRCRTVTAYIDELDDGIAYHAATSILASHFITDRTERQAYFAGIAARLRPGALLVNADLCGDRTSPTFDALEQAWLSMLSVTGMNEDGRELYRDMLKKSVGLLAPDDLAGLIASAGFTPPVRVYQGGLIHGHFAHRA
jgi:tRNA (cmo5U34)-methyltransferase